MRKFEGMNLQLNILEEYGPVVICVPQTTARPAGYS
jgi:hypothetical protein